MPVYYTYIVFLGEAEELSDLGGALGAEPHGVDDIREAGDLLLALLDDGHGKAGDLSADDAATDGFPLALAGSSGSVARVAVGEEEANTSGEQDALLHGETLLVVSTSDAEDVSLPLIANAIGWDLGTHLKFVSPSS